MKTIAHSIIAKRFGAMLALGIAGAVFAGAVTPAAAHKNGGGGGKHGHHGQHQPKPPKNPGPIGPLPKPQSQPMPKPVPQPPVVRDHRTPKPVIVRDHRTPTGGGVKVSDTPVIRDHRTPAPAPVVRDHRAPAPVATSTARPRTTTVKVAGVKILSVKTKGKACVGSYCL
jgi:hypothetical protein